MSTDWKSRRKATIRPALNSPLAPDVGQQQPQRRVWIEDSCFAPF